MKVKAVRSFRSGKVFYIYFSVLFGFFFWFGGEMAVKP